MILHLLNKYNDDFKFDTTYENFDQGTMRKLLQNTFLPAIFQTPLAFFLTLSVAPLCYPAVLCSLTIVFPVGLTFLRDQLAHRRALHVTV